jgi:beta-lactamase superfamily II metal-dependent hydrolase
MANSAFAGYPSAVIFEAPKNDAAPLNHLLWGDEVADTGETDGVYVKVEYRGKPGWMKKKSLQQERLLEVNFVDIGQGDGSFVITPDNELLIIDAGQEDNMHRFLTWRYNLRKEPKEVPVKAAVISHPDQDHYLGFTDLFRDPNFRYETVYHNGLIERTGNDPLGPRDDDDCLTNVVSTLDELREILDDAAKVGRKKYPTMLKKALDSERVGDMRILCADDGFMPGFEKDKALSIQVLGPVPKPPGRRLPWFPEERFGGSGPTKNGHSIVLKLTYGNVRMLLGGDLNSQSEKYLLDHYAEGGVEKPFEVEVAKACHHGSGDFRDDFLAGINALVTIISSGDNESYAHPRPDTLGAMGKAGRGTRPLIFSTELARSASESIKHPNELRASIAELSTKISNEPVEARRKKLEADFKKLLDTLDRTVTVYGMINVRTDGERMVVAQRLESNRSAGKKWDIHQFKPNADGKLEYVRREEH